MFVIVHMSHKNIKLGNVQSFVHNKLPNDLPVFCKEQKI